MKSGKSPRQAAGLIAVAGVVLFGFGAIAQCFCLAHSAIGEIVHYGCEP